MARKTESCFNIAGLSVLISARKENNQRFTAIHKVHSIPWPVIDPQLRDTLTYRPDIAWISQRQTLDTSLNTRSRPEVAQVIEPLSEDIGPADLDHNQSVAVWLQIRQALPAVAIPTLLD